MIQAGHVFTTHADTEVLLHGYEEWGTDLLQRVRGMFAFAIWDREKQELLGQEIISNQTLLLRGNEWYIHVWFRNQEFLPHPDFEKI